MVSRLWAVVSLSPIARAVNVASPAVVVRQRAWATCVWSPCVCRCCSRVAARVRLVMSRWCSGACSWRYGVGVFGASGYVGIGPVVVLSSVGLVVRLMVW